MMPPKFQLLALLAFAIAMIFLENQIQKLEESRGKLGKSLCFSTCVLAIRAVFRIVSILKPYQWWFGSYVCPYACFGSYVCFEVLATRLIMSPGSSCTFIQARSSIRFESPRCVINIFLRQYEEVLCIICTSEQLNQISARTEQHMQVEKERKKKRALKLLF